MVFSDFMSNSKDIPTAFDLLDKLSYNMMLCKKLRLILSTVYNYFHQGYATFDYMHWDQHSLENIIYIFFIVVRFHDSWL